MIPQMCTGGNEVTQLRPWSPVTSVDATGKVVCYDDLIAGNVKHGSTKNEQPCEVQILTRFNLKKDFKYERSIIMAIEVAEDGTVKWRFHRKAYRKARWRRLGSRLLADFQKDAGAHGLILIICNR